ncbi:putative membrane protein (DUF2306) [Mycolicibacterium phlei]|jgi:uncharacterized membrane protein|nr:membrane protein [Mycolicibacterium phlei DSM 43071]STZ16712.1 putative membrane protein (DUF2306) [Mycolicibacterium phlei]
MRMTYAYRFGLPIVVLAFLVYSLPPYLVGDTRVPATFGLHHPLLLGHVALGTVALVAGVAQVWPRPRLRHPARHRLVGRLYVVATVPSALFAAVIGALTPFGPLLAVSNTVLGVLWLGFTVGGYLAARAGRYATHRRRMLLSVTLALSVITNRLWAPVLFLICDPLRTSVFGGDDERYLWFTAGVAGWLGWVLPLAAVGWWLHRRPAVAATSIPTVSEVPRV